MAAPRTVCEAIVAMLFHAAGADMDVDRALLDNDVAAPDAVELCSRL
jgi:hypothetical protein